MNIIVNLIRIAFITGSLLWLAPLIPGVAFTGSWPAAVALGTAIWGFFFGLQALSRRFTGTDGKACPTPGTLKKIALGFWLCTALALWGVGAVLPGVITIGGAWQAIGASFLVLVGTVLSNFVTRPLEPEPKEPKA